MNLNAISVGKNPPHEINVIIEVPIGGETEAKIVRQLFVTPDNSP